MRFRNRVDRVLADWCLGIIAALLLALLALGIINRTVYNPAGQVRQYFQALREGNGEHALGILGASVPDSNAVALSGEAARSAFAALEDLSVANTDIEDGQRATVTVTYKVEGQEHSTDFHLTKVGSHWGVFDQWQINPEELPRIEVASPLKAATLNNVKVAVAAGQQDFAVFYPGVFTSSYQSALYSSQPQSLLVSSAQEQEQGQKLTVKLEPSETALNSVKHQIRSQLDSCAAQNTLYPVGCPFEYDFDGRVAGDLTWTILSYPEPEVRLDSAGKWALPDSQGKAEISFTALDLYTGETSPVTKTVNFTYSGKVTASDEELTVSSQ